MIPLQLKQALAAAVSRALADEWQVACAPETLTIQPTDPKYTGDVTLVLFPLLKLKLGSPDTLATRLLARLAQDPACPPVAAHQLVSGFLNLTLPPGYWLAQLAEPGLGHWHPTAPPPPDRRVMIEYPSPNTNKPLHLGHLRNLFLGDALARILTQAGFEVVRANLYNDKGIHICKSMLAWQQAGGTDTPESRNLKGDHLVGEYYVRFEKAYREQMQALIAAGATEEAARTEAPLFQAAAELYRRWEASDPDVLAVWRMMNQWVYDGHFDTYRRLGISFDKLYYESDTYLLGRQVVEEGLATGVFYRKPDGSVWVDLTDAGLDHKLVLRADGTSVYITQDLGTAQLKFEDFAIDRSIYVIGNEQDYHMKVLIEILRKMGKPYARGMYHLSYGMVELPHGRMKTREGTVVDADDLIDLMLATARQMTDELGKTDGLVATDREALYSTLALGALKYYLLRVDPVRKMVFNPEESIDFKGDTGTFVQYTYARTQGILRRADTLAGLPTDFSTYTALLPEELDVLKRLTIVPDVLAEAVRTYSPSVVAHYLHDLARAYSRFHSEVPVLKAAEPAAIAFRVALTHRVGQCLKQGLGLLGIDAPDRM